MPLVVYLIACSSLLLQLSVGAPAQIESIQHTVVNFTGASNGQKPIQSFSLPPAFRSLGDALNNVQTDIAQMSIQKFTNSLPQDGGQPSQVSNGLTQMASTLLRSTSASEVKATLKQGVHFLKKGLESLNPQIMNAQNEREMIRTIDAIPDGLLDFKGFADIAKSASPMLTNAGEQFKDGFKNLLEKLRPEEGPNQGVDGTAAIGGGYGNFTGNANQTMGGPKGFFDP